MPESFQRGDRLGPLTSEVIKKGSRIYGGWLKIIYRPGSGPRLSVVTAKRVGKSVQRNRLKRWTREIFRRNKNLFDNYEVVIIYEKGASERDFNQVKRAVKELWKKEIWEK